MKLALQCFGGFGIGIYSGISGVPIWLCVLFCAAWAILVEVIYAVLIGRKLAMLPDQSSIFLASILRPGKGVVGHVETI